MSNIYWSADTHIGHQSILKFMPNRPYASEENIQAHDEWILRDCREMSNNYATN